jgi:alpha/beta superfamily hydrolase
MPEVIFNGPEGRLEGRYHPARKRSRRPIAIMLHPHPQFGGTMNNQVVYNLYRFREARLLGPALQLPRRRPQPGPSIAASASSPTPPRRSTGCSRSTRVAPACWIAGFSFGAWIGMQLLMRRPEIEGFVSVSPPANMYDFSFLAPCPSSGLII